MTDAPEQPRPPFVEHALGAALALFASAVASFWLAHALVGPDVPGDVLLFALGVTTGMLTYAAAVAITLAAVALAVGRRGVLLRLLVGVPAGLACVLVALFARSGAFGADGAVSKSAGDLKLLLGPYGLQLLVRGVFLGVGLGLAAVRTGRFTEGLALLLPVALVDALTMIPALRFATAAPFVHRSLLSLPLRVVLATLALPFCLRFAAALLARIGLHTRPSD